MWLGHGVGSSWLRAGYLAWRGYGAPVAGTSRLRAGWLAWCGRGRVGPPAAYDVLEQARVCSDDVPQTVHPGFSLSGFRGLGLGFRDGTLRVPVT